MTGRRVRRRAREEETRRHIGAVKDDGPTGQRGSDPSAYRVTKRRRAREEATRRHIGSVKDDGPDDGPERKWPVGV